MGNGKWSMDGSTRPLLSGVLELRDSDQMPGPVDIVFCPDLHNCAGKVLARFAFNDLPPSDNFCNAAVRACRDQIGDVADERLTIGIACRRYRSSTEIRRQRWDSTHLPNAGKITCRCPPVAYVSNDRLDFRRGNKTPD